MLALLYAKKPAKHFVELIKTLDDDGFESQFLKSNQPILFLLLTATMVLGFHVPRFSSHCLALSLTQGISTVFMGSFH